MQAQESVFRSSAPAPPTPAVYSEPTASGANSAYPVLAPETEGSLPYPVHAPESAYPVSQTSTFGPVYPGLANFMGLELTEDVIRANMPEYLLPAVRPPVSRII